MTLIIDSGFNYDPDASAYIDAVEVADAQALETATRYAINDFVIGCKQDGIWTAIKASCILAGARTKEGAVVPLVNASGVAPTLNGTAGGWNYNRKTGLQGNGTNNYIDSGRNNSTASGGDPQNSRHVAVYSSAQGTAPQYYCGAGQIQGGSTVITRSDATKSLMSLSSTGSSQGTPLVNGLNAINRSDASNISVRNNGASISYSNFSNTPLAANLFIFGSNDSGLTAPTNARLAFYSIGESLDLALLDARVTALINAFGAAIP